MLTNYNDTISEVVFDFKEVKYITIDAIMYMLAFNFDKKKEQNVAFAMTLPEKTKERIFIQNCGIHQFLVNGITHDENIDKYCIIKTSNTVDAEMIKSIHDYIIVRTKHLSLLSRSRLYNIFVEIVTNSVEHAYTFNKVLPNWYCFVEDCGGFLKITFLDVGMGIIESLFKKQKGSEEDLTLRFSNKKYGITRSFIYRALNGQIIRANNENINRGRGLPEIYQFLRETKEIKNFYILSNKEYLSFSRKNNKIHESLYHLKKEFKGTLYYFEIDK